MAHVLPAAAREHLGRGPFRIARIRPGRILGPDADPAFGPLSVIDRATLSDGAFVAMHAHRTGAPGGCAEAQTDRPRRAPDAARGLRHEVACS